MPQSEQLARTPEPLSLDGEGTNHLSRSPDCEVGESRARATPWRGIGGSEREHGEERVNSYFKKSRFQGGEGGQAKRRSLGEVRESMSR